jgi:glutamine cyclotransferase
VGIVYDKYSFKQLQRFTYTIAEGWGLEYNGTHFLMTDGSNTLYFIEPESFEVVRKLEVMDNNGPVKNLNELELVNGKLYANVYMSNYVVIIDPETGMVTGRIDFSGLLNDADLRPDTDVLNGIAYNSDNGNLFVTGKNWPKMFEVSIVAK